MDILTVTLIICIGLDSLANRVAWSGYDRRHSGQKYALPKRCLRPEGWQRACDPPGLAWLELTDVPFVFRLRAPPHYWRPVLRHRPFNFQIVAIDDTIHAGDSADSPLGHPVDGHPGAHPPADLRLRFSSAIGCLIHASPPRGT
jgi:hypothetical protein